MVNLVFTLLSKLSFCTLTGSVHDAHILRESSVWRAFESHPKPLDGIILGDSAYPLRDWLLTPFLKPASAGENKYNEAIFPTRVTIERCNGVLKRRFHCLASILQYQPHKACKIITSCLVLHNMALEFGIPIEALNENMHQQQQEADPGLEEMERGQITGRIKRQQFVRRYFTVR